MKTIERNWTNWEYRGNSHCPECGSITAQFIRYEILPDESYGEWEVTESCDFCDYEN